MRYYPVNLDLLDRPIVIIGGGKVGLRKVRGLIRSGAQVKVIEPVPSRALTALARAKKINLVKRAFQVRDLRGMYLAVAATEKKETNQKIVREAKKRGILLNVVDQPKLCDFVFPAFFERGDLLIAISTGGSSPAFAKKIRQDLEKQFGKEYSRLLHLLKDIRTKTLPSKSRTKVLKKLVRNYFEIKEEK